MESINTVKEYKTIVSDKTVEINISNSEYKGVVTISIGKTYCDFKAVELIKAIENSINI